MGSHLKIFLSILSVSETETAFTWPVMVSWLSITILRFFAWVISRSVGLSLAGHQVESQSEVFFSTITTSELEEVDFHPSGDFGHTGREMRNEVGLCTVVGPEFRLSDVEELNVIEVGG